MMLRFGKCLECGAEGKALRDHTVEFLDDPNRGPVRSGCVLDYHDPWYKVKLLSGTIIYAQGFEFVVDRRQLLVNYPDAYGRNYPPCGKYPAPNPDAREWSDDDCPGA